MGFRIILALPTLAQQAHIALSNPEPRLAVTGISYKANDGTDMIIKVTKDMKENIVSRESCSFNVTGDIRLCVDWDKVTMHRDMKNGNGEWFKVSDD